MAPEEVGPALRLCAIKHHARGIQVSHLPMRRLKKAQRARKEVDAKDIALVERDIEKNLRAYRRLTGEAAEVDSMIRETAAWLMKNLHYYMTQPHWRHTPRLFPPIWQPIYKAQRAKLANNRLEEYMDSVDAMADAQPNGVDVSRFKRVVARQRESLSILYTDIQWFAWIAGLRYAIAQDSKVARYEPLLKGRPFAGDIS